MVICWDNLEKLRYSRKTGKWYKENDTYIYMDECKVCGNGYLTNTSQIKKGLGFLCGEKCSSKYRMNDLKNKKFGMLSVLKYGYSKNGKPVWICKCDCGNIKEILGNSLVCGKTKSCGCWGRGVKNNLINKKFGGWIVIEDVGNSIVTCKCDCGVIKEVNKGSLLNKRSKSCGCLKIKELKKNNLKENNPSWSGGVTEKNIPLYDTYAHQIDWCEEVRRSPKDENIMEVKCTYCGKWHVPKKTNVVDRNKSINGKQDGEARFYCSIDCKKECPIYHKSKYSADNPRSNKNQEAREVQPELRQMVFARDNYTCVKCGSTKSLHCHHKEGILWAPLESADLDMCMTVCKKCHKKIHKKDGCKYSDMKCGVK